MHTLTFDHLVNSPPDAVWALVGPFGSVAEWHPGVTACVLSQDAEGRTLRTLTYANGKQGIERLISHDDAARSYHYTVVGGALPVQFFNGQFQVVGNAGQSRVRWTATFEVPAGAPEERVVAILDSILQAAGPGLTAKLG